MCLDQGKATGALSKLHEKGIAQRLAIKRGGYGIYVLTEFVNDRPTVPHRRNRPLVATVERVVEISSEKEVQVTDFDPGAVRLAVRAWHSEKSEDPERLVRLIVAAHGNTELAHKPASILPLSTYGGKVY